MKIFIPILLSLLFLGSVYVILSFAERFELSKASAWPSTPGQVLQGGYSGARIGGPARAASGPAAMAALIAMVPSAKYSYIVKGKEYQTTKTLWPCLTFVTLALFKDELAKRDAAIQHTMDNLSNPDMYKLQTDPQTGKTTIGGGGLQALLGAAPPVTVHYDPTNPEISSLDPTVLKPADSLFWSGAWMLIIGAVGCGLLKFHSFVTAPAPDPEPLGGGQPAGNWKRY